MDHYAVCEHNLRELLLSSGLILIIVVLLFRTFIYPL